MPLFGNIRFYVLTFSFLLSLAIFVWVKVTVSDTLQPRQLAQYYALTSITFLYLTLLASPATRYFRFLPYQGKYLRARRALGISVLYFGLLHARFAFFNLVGGFGALPYLRGNVFIGVWLGIIQLLIFLIIGATSSDFMIDKLTFARWKFVQRFVYLASLFVVIHALLLGSHFKNLSGAIPIIFLIALIFLLVLEALRFLSYLKKRF